VREAVVINSCDPPDRSRQNMTSGGSSDSEQSVPTVTPWGFPLLSAVVTTDTAVATCARTSPKAVTRFIARRPRP
jgi:hypothetical protein